MLSSGGSLIISDFNYQPLVKENEVSGPQNLRRFSRGCHASRVQNCCHMTSKVAKKRQAMSIKNNSNKNELYCKYFFGKVDKFIKRNCCTSACYSM